MNTNQIPQTINQQQQEQKQYSESEFYKPVYIQRVGKRQSIKKLIDQFENNNILKNYIIKISDVYDAFRKIKGDGNCYYRAIGFAYLEHLYRQTTPDQEMMQFQQKLENLEGYFQIRIGGETHIQIRRVFIRLLNELKDQKIQYNPRIHEFLEQQLHDNQNSYDDALVWEMRTLTANYLEAHMNYFQDFIDIPFQNVIQNTLTMGVEADGISIGPLQVVLNLKIDIVSLALDSDQPYDINQMKTYGNCVNISILYRPGHYDLIYPKYISNTDGFDSELEIWNDINVTNIQNQKTKEPYFTFVEQNEDFAPKNEKIIFKQEFIIKFTLQPIQSSIQFSQHENLQKQSELINQSSKNLQNIQNQGNKPIGSDPQKEQIHINQKQEILQQQNNVERGQLQNKNFQDQIQIQNQQIKEIKRINEETEVVQQELLLKQQQSNQLQEKILECLNCKQFYSMEEIVELNCEHIYCKSCLMLHIEEQTNGLYITLQGEPGYDNIKCKVCKQVLDLKDIKQAIGEEMFNIKLSDSNQRLHLLQQQPQKIKKINGCRFQKCDQQCEIILQLHCKVKVCQVCLYKYIEVKTDGKFFLNKFEKSGEIKCAFCNKCIIKKEIIQTIGQELYEVAVTEATKRENEMQSKKVRKGCFEI